MIAAYAARSPRLVNTPTSSSSRGWRSGPSSTVRSPDAAGSRPSTTASLSALDVDDLVDAAYQPFQSRAAIWIALGVLGIAIAALLAGARNWARVILTLAAIGFAAALVCQWLPASNAAVRARKKG